MAVTVAMDVESADERALAFQYYKLNALLSAGASEPEPEATAAQELSQEPKKSGEDEVAVVEGEGDAVPRLPLAALSWKNRARFNALMETHSFVVLTHLGDKIESTYAQLMGDFEDFFTSADDEWKTGCTSKQIYRNENGTPMWYCGYEHTSVRDCFRVACGDMSRLVWPNEAFESRWLAHQRTMQQICDKALSLTLGYKIDPCKDRKDTDFSVCYGLHYPNTVGSGQSELENVFEHVDPSLYVAEPVPTVEGLDVFDQHSQQWIKAEKVCVPGKEIVLFCGKALQRCTEGRIKGTLHRVRRTPDRRFCVIYEQKYEEYFLE